jgi:hypothetical protein
MVMAITGNPYIPLSPLDFPPGANGASGYIDSNIKEHLIQGHVFEAKFVLSDVQVIAGTFTEDDIKKELANKLVYELMKSKHIEFTKVPDLINSSHTFRARIFAVPDTNVRILREEKVI